MSKDDINVLPDGSAFTTATFPLPADHWVYDKDANDPPMPLRVGVGKTLRVEMSREELAVAVWAAAKHAVRGATFDGEDMDFDPDALCQNMVVGLLGFFTEDGTRSGKLIPKR